MSNRYHFDLESDREVISDGTGVVVDTLDLATEEVADVLREMRASGELLTSNVRWELVIRDEDGNELKRIPL